MPNSHPYREDVLLKTVTRSENCSSATKVPNRPSKRLHIPKTKPELPNPIIKQEKVYEKEETRPKQKDTKANPRNPFPSYHANP